MIEQDIDFECPYCGALNSTRVESFAGTHQQFTSDCENCCRPIQLTIRVAAGDVVGFDVHPENE